MSKKIKKEDNKEFTDYQRIEASPDKGLTSEQATERMWQGLNNINTQPKSKSIKRIFYDNIVTLFNILNIILGIAVFAVASYRNLLRIGNSGGGGERR